MDKYVDVIIPRGGRSLIERVSDESRVHVIKHLDGISPEIISELNIPTGIPLVYELDDNLKPIPQLDAIAPLTGRYLGNQADIRARIEGVRNQTK